jgi:hypothetical protein
VSFDVIGLIADWDPAVDACRAAGGADFYWDVPDGQALPYADERDRRGYDFMDAGHYYELLRERLPGPVRDTADAFLGLLYGDLPGCTIEPPDDLARDAGLPHSGTYYSMRPGTVRTARERAAALPWAEILPVGEAMPVERITRHDVCEVTHFEDVVWAHKNWIQAAAEAGRGLIVLLSH